MPVHSHTTTERRSRIEPTTARSEQRSKLTKYGALSIVGYSGDLSESSPEERAKWVRETPSKHPLSTEREKRGVFARAVTFLLSRTSRRNPGLKDHPPGYALARRPDLLEELFAASFRGVPTWR